MLAVIYAVNAIFNIIYTLVLVDAFASWLPFLYSKRVIAKILYVVHTLVEPFMSPVRKLVAKTPLAGMPVDFSPVVLLVLLNVTRNILVMILNLVFFYG